MRGNRLACELTVTTRPSPDSISTSISAAGDNHDARARDLPLNPHVRFFDARWRGYLRCEIDHALWRADLRAVDDVTDPRSGVRTLQTLHVESGRAGVVA